MPKLAIYIPKHEMREIDRWRKQLNFSKIFMRALRREIQERTRVPQANRDDLARAADHYRRLLADESTSLVDSGYELGVEQVVQCRLTPHEIRKVLAVAGSEALTAEALEQVSAAMHTGGESLEQLAARLGCDDGTHPTWRESLCAGYAQGVSDGWRRVCQQLNQQRE